MKNATAFGETFGDAVEDTLSIRQISELLETALQTIAGLNTASYLKDGFSTPAAVIGIDTMDYHSTFKGGDVGHAFTILLIVGRSDDLAATQLLDGFMSQAGADPSSVQGALEADPTLGGQVAGTVVQKSGPPESLPLGASGALYVSVPFVVVVHA